MTPEEKTAAIVAAIKATNPDLTVTEEQPLTIVLMEIFSVSESCRKIEGHLAAISAALKARPGAAR